MGFFSSLSPISISLSSHTLAIYIFILNTWRIYALTSQSIGAAPCSVSPHSITIDVHVRQKINGCGFGASTFFPTLCFVFCRTMKPSNKKMCTTEAYVSHSLSVYIDVADEHVAKPFATQPTVCVCVCWQARYCCYRLLFCVSFTNNNNNFRTIDLFIN